MSFKDLWNRRKERPVKIGFRILAILLAVAIVVPGLFTIAGQADKTPAENTAQILGDSGDKRDEGSPIVIEDNGIVLGDSNHVIKEVTINAPDRWITVKEADTLDLLEGVTVTALNGHDYSSCLSATTPENFNPKVPGEYRIDYHVIDDGIELAFAYSMLYIASDYQILAEDLVLAVGQYETLEQVNLLEGVTAVDPDGKDITAFVVLAEIQPENAIDPTIAGEYHANLALIIEGETKAELVRKVIVKDNGYTFIAPDLTFYLDDIKDGEESHFKDLLFITFKAENKDGEDVTDKVVITDDGGGGEFDTVGVYTVTYSVMEDDVVVASTKRKVIITTLAAASMRQSRTSASNLRMGGNYHNASPSTPTPKDELAVDVRMSGRTSIRKWMEVPKAQNRPYDIGWVPQYYPGQSYAASDPNDIPANSGSDSNGIVLILDGVIYASNYFGSTLLPTKLAWVNDSKFSPEEQVVIRTYSPSGNSKIELDEIITLRRGDNVIEREWKIRNKDGFTPVNASLIYGGDTYFSGYDSGWSGYSHAASGIAMSWRGKEQGTMTLTGSAGDPATNHYTGDYSQGAQQARAGKLNPDADLSTDQDINRGKANMLPISDSIALARWNNPEYRGTHYWGENNGDYWFHDSSYYLEWNFGTVAGGGTSTITSYETFAGKGSIQLSPTGDKSTPPQTIVTHSFIVRNVSAVNQESFNVKFFATSENGWTTVVRPDTLTNFPPGAYQTVYVDVHVEKVDKNGDPVYNGFKDKLTLRAEYLEYGTSATPEEVTASQNTMTIIDPDKAVITTVPITYLKDFDLRAEVNYRNVSPAQQPVEFAISIHDRLNVKTSVPTKIIRLMPGEEFPTIDLTGLTVDERYYIDVRATDSTIIEYPHNSTSFILGQEIIVPKSLTLTPPEVTMNRGSTYNGFQVTFLPANTTDMGIIWTSSNNSIASINQLGEVKGEQVGTVTITAKAAANPERVFGTSTLHVVDQVNSLTVTPTTITLKKGDTAEATATVAPATALNKKVNWNPLNAMVATGTDITNDPSSSTQKGSIKGVNDGSTTVRAISDQTPTVFANVIVNVDGTAPSLSTFTVEKTANNWRAVNTNKQLKITLGATDAVVNGFASGVKTIYYKVVGATASAPVFNPTNPTGWESVDAPGTNFLLDATKLPGNDASYKIYVVVKDIVGNYSTMTDGGHQINVDTTLPSLEFVDGGGKDIHVLTGDPVDLTKGVKATDNGVDVTDKLVITPATVATDTVKKVAVEYKYTDAAGNVTKLQRTVFVHGRPTIVAEPSINVNQAEGSIILAPVDAADLRIKLKTPNIPYYSTSGNLTEAVATLRATEGGTLKNTLTLPGLVGNTFPMTKEVTYTAECTNNSLIPSTPQTQQKINVVIYKNGQVPGGPDPIVDPIGPITPPVNPPGPGDPDPGIDPGLIDPLDPEGVWRIRYYQNNGVIMSNGERKSPLTADMIINQVNAVGASKAVTIINKHGFEQAFDASSLEEALLTIDQYTVKFRFTDTATSAVTFYYTYLRVNGDIQFDSANPVEARMGVVVPIADYSGANNMTARFIEYTNATKTLEVSPPNAADMNTSSVRSYHMKYTADYPYELKNAPRLLRVHGTIDMGQGGRFDMRVGGNIFGGIPAKVTLAPVGVGTTGVVKDVTNLVLSGAFGDTNQVGNFTQDYKATYPLGAEYGSGQSFLLTGQSTRDVFVHSMPQVTANTMTVGLGYTEAMLGDARENLLLALNANVVYFGQMPINLKTVPGAVTWSHNIKFGVVGTYKINFVVKDDGVATRPAGLQAETATYSIDFIVSDAVSGREPTIEGNRDINWILNTPMTESDVLAHVYGMDHNTGGTLPVAYVIKNTTGTTITAAQVPNRLGDYTIIYTAIDSLGNSVSETNVIHVVGDLEKDFDLNSSDVQVDLPVGSSAAAISYNAIKLKYQDSTGVTHTINPISDPSYFIITNNIDFTTAGRYIEKFVVSHPAVPTVTTSFEREVRIHGIPAISATNKLVKVNASEGRMNVLNPFDTRFRVVAPDYTYYARSGNSVTEETMSQAQKITATGEFVTGGILDLSRATVLPKETTVTFTMEQNNPMLTSSSLTSQVTVRVLIAKNGTNPEGPDPEVDPIGPITPPVDPPGPGDPDPGTDPTVDPMDPTGVYRVNYYQNNGVIMSNGVRNPNLTSTSIINQVNAPTADTKEVFIELTTGNLVELTQANLDEALKTIGNKRITFKFTQNGAETGDFYVTFFYAYLRVNGDIIKASANPIDTTKDTVLTNAQLEATGVNMTAQFEDYAHRTQSLLVTSKDSVANTATIQSILIDYLATYPYETKTMNRLLRVHGTPVFTTVPMDLRVGATSIPMTGVSATVLLAPPTAGAATTTPKTITTITQSGANGNLTMVGSFNQSYAAQYLLDSSYGTGAGFAINGTASRQVNVHSMPVVTGTTLTVAKTFTEAALGNPLTNPRLNIKGSVEYAGIGAVDITSAVTFVSHNINFGTPGNYEITFTVKDDGAAGRPTGLPAETATTKIPFIISDGAVGDLPTITGNQTILWLEGQTITNADLLRGVSAMDNNTNTPLPVLAEVYSGTTLINDLSQVIASPGEFTVNYSTTDENGNIEKATSNLDVYGKIHFTSQDIIGNTREGYTPDYIFDVLDQDARAVYKNPKNQDVVVNYNSAPSLFTREEIDSGGKNGNLKVYKLTVNHPLFQALNNDSTTFEWRTHGAIEFGGISAITSKRYRVGDSVNTLENVTAYYLDYQYSPVSVTPVVSSKPNVGTTTEDKAQMVNYTYSAEDNIIDGEVSKRDATLKFDKAVGYSASPTSVTFRRMQVNTAAKLKAALSTNITVRNGGMYYAESPNSLYGSSHSGFDIGQVTLNKVGTYTVYVQAVVDGVLNRVINIELKVTN